MRNIGLALLILGVLMSVPGIFLFYQANSALTEAQAQISALGQIPLIGWLAQGLTQATYAAQLQRLQQLRSLGLLLGLGGVGAMIVGIVLTTTAKRG